MMLFPSRKRYIAFFFLEAIPSKLANTRKSENDAISQQEEIHCFPLFGSNSLLNLQIFNGPKMMFHKKRSRTRSLKSAFDEEGFAEKRRAWRVFLGSCFKESIFGANKNGSYGLQFFHEKELKIYVFNHHFEFESTMGCTKVQKLPQKCMHTFCMCAKAFSCLDVVNIWLAHGVRSKKCFAYDICTLHLEDNNEK